MTIHGVGTDIVRIERMEASLARHGERFARRILADAEMEAFHAARSPARLLAKRFAAKEAAVKALGTGFRDGIGLRDIAVDHEPGGRPFLRFSGGAEALCRTLGIHESHLSLSDESEYAIAFVTLVGRKGA